MQISFVLVEPARPSNVGAAARALKTMGFSRLILVNSDLHQHKEAHWVAHGAQDILENCETFPDLDMVRANHDLLIATTARKRNSARHYFSPAQLNERLQQQSGRAALIFGCEASGLSNSQLAVCDLFSYVSLAQPYPSLNLGQAVMVYSFALANLAIQLGLKPQPPHDESLQKLKQRVTQTLAPYPKDKTAKVQEWLLEHVSGLSDRDMRMAHQLLGLLTPSEDE